GENVYPKEVEDILLAHPNVRDACVVPAPHGTKGEVPVAFLVERQRGVSTEDEVKRFFLARGAPYAHPRRVIFVDALPLGGTGKLDRAALRNRAREVGVDPCATRASSRTRRTCAFSPAPSRRGGSDTSSRVRRPGAI